VGHLRGRKPRGLPRLNAFKKSGAYGTVVACQSCVRSYVKNVEIIGDYTKDKEAQLEAKKAELVSASHSS